MEVGEAPASLQRRAKAKESRPLTDAELAWQVRSSRALLLHCTGRIRWPSGEGARLVDKPFDECRPDEMTIEDLSDADANAILEAVAALRKESAEAVQTFRAPKPEADDDAGHNGEALPGAAEPDAIPVGS